MGLGDIGALIEADNRARALAETFGHLAPDTEAVYIGSILFTHSGYGDGTVPIRADFDGLPDSPWFYDGMCEFILDHHEREHEGKVFVWKGTYVFKNWPRVYNDNDDIIQDAGHEHVFTGEFTEVQIPA